MKERFLRHLLPEVTQQLLPLAQRLTGKAPIIQRVNGLPNDVNAMLIGPQRPDAPWEIHYAKGQEPFLDHIIAHEVGHLVRLYQTPAAERLQVASTPKTRERAARQLLPDLARLLRMGIPEQEVSMLFGDWYDSLCGQLANFPADLRIEQWAFQTFPGLRAIQERSLVADVQRAFPLLDPHVAAVTPLRVFRPMMAMNAAQAWHTAMLFNRPELLTPFQEYNLAIPGRNLARMVLDAPDHAHRSDMEATDEWAQELGLTGWFEWQPHEGSW